MGDIAPCYLGCDDELGLKSHQRTQTESEASIVLLEKTLQAVLTEQLKRHTRAT